MHAFQTIQEMGAWSTLSSMEWHNISDPASPELDRLAERYRLHPLHVEDCRHRNQSAKIEEGQSYLFTVMKVIRFDPQGELEIADLDIFSGRTTSSP